MSWVVDQSRATLTGTGHKPVKAWSAGACRHPARSTHTRSQPGVSRPKLPSVLAALCAHGLLVRAFLARLLFRLHLLGPIAFLRLLLLRGPVMPNGASGRSAQCSMPASNMASEATNGGSFQAALGLCNRGGDNAREESCSDQWLVHNGLQKETTIWRCSSRRCRRRRARAPTLRVGAKEK